MRRRYWVEMHHRLVYALMNVAETFISGTSGRPKSGQMLKDNRLPASLLRNWLCASAVGCIEWAASADRSAVFVSGLLSLESIVIGFVIKLAYTLGAWYRSVHVLTREWHVAIVAVGTRLDWVVDVCRGCLTWLRTVLSLPLRFHRRSWSFATRSILMWGRMHVVTNTTDRGPIRVIAVRWTRSTVRSLCMCIRCFMVAVIIMSILRLCVSRVVSISCPWRRRHIRFNTGAWERPTKLAHLRWIL